jgi:Xaa-Pro aminopeptidase
VDVFPRSDVTFYWADITRTFVKGTPSPALGALYEAVRRAQEAALERLRSGERACDVHRAAVDVFEGLGYRNGMKRGVPEGFIHGLGHGVGLEIHENPRLNASSIHRLETGEVVTIEPGLYYFGIGGVRLEDMAVVGKGGNENLTRYPKRFAIP